MAHRQFQSIYDIIFVGSLPAATIGTGGAGSGTVSSTTVTVTGVKIGDIVEVFNYGNVLTAGAPIVADVSAANTVRLAVLNNTAGGVTAPYNASTVYKVVIKRLQNN